jgi:cyclopropane-fatty-acyl-phospholipid synthase
MYNGNFSIPLETAQERKHAFIAENLQIKPGSKVLDMGCGWGPFLPYLKKIGAKGVGVTLSSGQAEACKKMVSM